MNELERAILSAALAGPGRALAALRGQAEDLVVKEREFTGVGFFTEFTPLPASSRVPVHDFEISGIGGSSPHLDNGFGAVVFIRSGQIDTIECFTYDEPWTESGTKSITPPEKGDRDFDQFLTE